MDKQIRSSDFVYWLVFVKTIVDSYEDILSRQYSYYSTHYAKHGMEPVNNNPFKTHVWAARGVSNDRRASDGVLFLS